MTAPYAKGFAPVDPSTPDALPFLPADLQEKLETILVDAQAFAVARAAELGISPFTTVIGLARTNIQTCLMVSRPVTLRMFRHYLDAMDASVDSVKHKHHVRKCTAAAEQLAQILKAQQGVEGHA